MSIERIYITAGPYQDIISGIQMILSFSDGVVKLVGQDGAGKTSLLQKLQKHIEEEGQPTLLFSPPPKSVLELHNTVTRTFRLSADVSFRKALARHLTSLPRDQQHLVLLFDDAETMDDETLSDLLLFRNVKQGEQSLVSLVLFGSAGLDARLQAPELAELVQDIVLNYELNPLNFKQLAAFCKEAIPALGLRIALPGTRELEHLLQVTGGLPGAVLEQLPVLAANPLPAIEEEAKEAVAEAAVQPRTQHPVVSAAAATPLAAPRNDAAKASDTPDTKAAEPSLAPRDEKADKEAGDGGRRVKVLGGGLALAASLAAAWFFFPQLANLLRSSETSIVATRAPTLSVPADPAPAAVAPAEPTPLADPVVEVVDVAEVVEVAEIAEVPEDVAQEDTPLLAETDLVAEPASEDNTPAPEALVAEAETETAPATDLAAIDEEEEEETLAATAPVSTASVVPVLPVVQGVAPTEANLLAAVEAWVNAWQSQDVDGYFSAYHTDFAPLYQSTRAAWRDNRVRSIQRPRAIRIGLEDFRVVGNAEIGMQVAFWLNYQSPDYADRTYKELVIGNDVDGSLRILREANRQVVAMAPGAVAPATPAPLAAQPPRAVAGSSAPTHTQIGPPVAVGSGFSLAVTPRAAAGVDSTLAATLHDFVGGWLDAWQRQDLNDYFAHYHPDFRSGSHASREDWAADRREKISRPLLILIRLTDLEVGPARNGRHDIVLEMEYHSTYYADRTVKEVALARKADGGWGIISERNREVTRLPISRLVPDRSVTLRSGPNTVHEVAL